MYAHNSMGGFGSKLLSQSEIAQIATAVPSLRELVICWELQQEAMSRLDPRYFEAMKKYIVHAGDLTVYEMDSGQLSLEAYLNEPLWTPEDILAME